MLKIGMVTLFEVMIGLVYIEHTAISSDSNRIAASTWYELYIFNKEKELIQSYNVPKIEFTWNTTRANFSNVNIVRWSVHRVAVNTGLLWRSCRFNHRDHGREREEKNSRL